MTTKELVINIKRFSSRSLGSRIDPDTLEPEFWYDYKTQKIEYHELSKKLKSYFYELYLEGNNLLIDKLLKLLNDDMEYWDNFKKETRESESQVDGFEEFADLKIGHFKSLISTLEKLNNTNPKPELTINQIALIHVYSGIQITRGNGNETARKYGHSSGEKLFQRYTYYSSTSNRKGKPTGCTETKLKNKINLIKSVIEYLPVDKQEWALDEKKVLEATFKKDYL